MIKNYEKYLDLIQGKLNGMFEKQKPYIACKKGCSLCCEKGEYPFSEIEFKYAMIGMGQLPFELQKKIRENAKKIKEDKKNYTGDGAFMYQCPFLIDNACSIYNHRGIICRNFGLLLQREGRKPSIPFCSKLGLNYSSVYDVENNSVTEEKFKESGLDVEPLMFNMSYPFLTEKVFADGFGFKFGEKRTLIDWF